MEIQIVIILIKVATAWMASNFSTSSPEIFTVVRPCILGSL